MALELHRISIREVSSLLRRRKLSPVELTRAFLKRIEMLDGRLNSYVTVMAEQALADARRAEEEIGQGRYRGPLHGVPVALKDLIWTRGVRTTAGSKILAEWVPQEDATVVRRLKEAGVVLLGKVGLHEWAYGITSNNPRFGPIRNPWNTDRIPGGSSGGSGAAVAAGLCTVALGTDTGGSVRIPAALCGIVGLKPTYGRVSCHGVIPLSWSADHVGPMARTVSDCAILLQAIAGHDPLDAASARARVSDYTRGMSKGVRGLRVGVLSSPYYAVPDSSAAKAFQKALCVLKDLGVELCEVPFEEGRLGNVAHMVLVSVEATEAHRPYLTTRLADYGKDVADLLLQGLFYSGADYVWASQIRRWMAHRLMELLSRVDVLVLPSNGFGAVRIGEEWALVEGKALNVARGMFRHMPLFNSAGLPAVSVPCGFTNEGLPVGMQIAGRPFAESTVLRVAYAFEQATPWHTMAPPV